MRVLVLRGDNLRVLPADPATSVPGSPARSDSAGLPANGRTRMKSDSQW